MPNARAQHQWQGRSGEYIGGRPHSGAGANDRQAAADEWIEKLSWLMDRSIPLCRGYSIGLDPLIGLIPGVGDLIGTAVSAFIVMQAQRAGIPRATIMRMIANVGIDSAVGAIPFFGDLFDFAFKANQKNLELYRQSMNGSRSTRGDVAFLFLVVILLGVLFAVPLLAVLWLANLFV